MADYTVTVNRSQQIGVSNYRTGVNWIDQTLHGDATSVNNALAILADSVNLVCTHTMWFGPFNPWRTNTETEAQMHWANESGEPDNLDYRFDKLVGTGNAISVTLGLTPTWMVTDDLSHNGENLNGTFQTTAPTVANFPNMAELARRFITHMRSRYGANKIERLQIWNEFKGFFSNSLGRYRHEDMTNLYNQIWAVVQNFNNSLPAGEKKILMGGLYPSLNVGSTSPSGLYGYPNNQLTLSSGSKVDPRYLSALLYWRDNASGFDFVCCDGVNKLVTDVMPWFAQEFPDRPVIWNEFYAGTEFTDASAAENLKRAQLAINLINCVKAGITSAYLWQPERRTSTTPGSDAVLFNYQGVWTSTASAGGGQRTDTADILKALKENFPPGTTLYQTTVTPTNSNIVALASATAVLIVNNTTGSVDIDVV